jgi:OOP family OmpA-OmpF porin
MRHSLVYRVEQVFLVHAPTGLLLQHVPENTSEDADLISSMLTAIGDFVNDSFEPRQTGELRAFAAGDLTVLVEPGPQAYLAAVIRGTPPETLPVKLQTTLETIHLQWCNPLASFDGNAAAFETTRPLLDECIEKVLASDQAARRAGLRKYAWVIPAVLILAGLTWWLTRGARQWNAALARLDAEPGITVIRSDRSGGKWRVSGLRDPLAQNPALLLASRGIDTNDVVADWSSYISTEPPVMLERARRVLAPPGGITLSLSGDTLVATGRAPAFWIVKAETLAPALAGVGGVDLSRVSPGLPPTIEKIANEVESIHVLFATGSSALDSQATANVQRLAGELTALVRASGDAKYELRLHVVGRADPTGVESDNLELSRRRANAVRDRLVAAGARQSLITVDATGSTDPLPADSPNERARLNRSVSFRVQAQPSTRAVGAERVP